MSLENTYNAKDLEEWDERIHRTMERLNDGTMDKASITYTIEPKFDGLGIELIYEKGQFRQAITRGDGWIGEDVTINSKTIKNIPQRLKQPITISVR